MNGITSGGFVSSLISGLLMFAYVAVGETLPNAEMPVLDGGTRQVFTGQLTVFIFFRPGQEQSLETLRALGKLRTELGSRPVEWLGLASDRFPADEVRNALAASGVDLVTLIDTGDELYGKLGVRIYPSIGIASPGRELLAYLPYSKVNYGAAIRAHVRHALGDIDDAALSRALNPEDVSWADNGAKAESNIRLAKMLVGAGKMDKALETAEKAVATAPQLAEAHGLLGWILAAQGDCETARKSVERALELDPDNATAADALDSCN